MDPDRRLLEQYTRRQRDRGLSPDTIRSYRWIFDAFTAHLHAHGLTLLTVQRDDVADWIASRGHVNRTRAIYTKRLDLLFRWLQDEGARRDVPTKGIPHPKVPRAVPRPLSTDGLYRALATADPRVSLMLTLTAYAGLRRGEITVIDRSDIRSELDPPLLLVHGKGQKERLVPIGPPVAAAFARYGLPERGPLFPGPSGRPLTRAYVGKLISDHLRACGVDATAHNGRHLFATSLYEGSGRDLRVVQEMLGHASPTTTAMYAAWNPARAAAAVAALPVAPLLREEGAA